MSLTPNRQPIAASAPTPRLHLRLVKEALPAPARLTGQGIARRALELALTVPLAQALAQAITTLAEPGAMNADEIDRVAATAFKLITEGLRADDAVSVALHERRGPRASSPVPDGLKSLLFPPQLTGQNVVKLALELNASGTKMDDAIIEALKKFSAPRAISDEQARLVLEAAQKLFADGLRAVEAFNIALRKTLPKGSSGAQP